MTSPQAGTRRLNPIPRVSYHTRFSAASIILRYIIPKYRSSNAYVLPSLNRSAIRANSASELARILRMT